ncbi:BamA/TamA family outer membrane protein [Aeromonas sp. NJAU223]|uniref:BamA/TamA family outer membrane protein n=1 Tax=Aeromonas sp. NJAU223 TaxID=3115650 RepID=UPI003DA8169F
MSLLCASLLMLLAPGSSLAAGRVPEPRAVDDAGKEPTAEQKEAGAETASADAPSLIRGDDGKLDVSRFIDQAYGFMPVVIPITEPALGLGAVGALAFIDKPAPGSGFNRPNITLVGGLGTDQGTRGYFGGDLRYWLDNRLNTHVGAIKTSLNLDYYGGGRGDRTPRSYAYTLDLTGGMVRGRYRLGESDNWLGMNYLFANTRATFDSPMAWLQNDREQRISGLGASFTHDSRDNMFTPRAGSYLEASATRFAPGLGSDIDFTRYGLTAIQYLPLAHNASLGINGSLSGNAGDTPFYMSPYVSLRGVPAMRYQGQRVAQVEAELLWPIWDRYSLVGFGGVGKGFGDSGSALFDERSVAAGGVGVRYEIARKYGLHMGLDLAWSREGGAVYVQFGSAWMRP